MAHCHLQDVKTRGVAKGHVTRRGSDCEIGLGESAAPLLLSAPIAAYTE